VPLTGKWFFCLIWMLLLPVVYSAEMAAASLKQMVQRSDYVVVGKVNKIFETGRTKIAQVDVYQALKGKEQKKVLYFRAKPGICDVSGAKEGETGIYFLKFAPPYEESVRRFAEETGETLPDSMNNNLCYLVNAGQGRLIVDQIDGRTYILTSEYGNKKFPKSLKIVWLPKTRNYLEGRIKFADVVAYLKNQIGK
jgi:hypothetical protein